MRNPVKSLMTLVLLLVAVVVLGAIAVDLFADGAVRVAVETAGTRALDVPVDIEKAKLSIMRGTLSLRGLTVSNPAGYQQKTLLDLDRGDIHVDTKSLLSDTTAIKDIRLDGMKVAIEQKGLDNNLRDVIRSLRRDRTSSGRKLQIDSLEITNITVDVKLLPVPGQADTLSLKLAPIQMTDLGRSEPLDIATLTTKVLLAITEAIAEQGGDVLPKDMIADLTGVLGKAVDIGRVIFGTGQDAGSSLEKNAERLGKGITEGLKGLVKPKSQEEQ
jgi:hypothetical protein